MSKKLIDIIESFGNKELPTVVGPAELAYLNDFARKLNTTQQPSLESVCKLINRELNKYGFALNTVTPGVSEYANPQYYRIVTFATKETASNVFVKVSYMPNSTASQYDLRQDGGSLKISPEVTFVEADFDFYMIHSHSNEMGYSEGAPESVAEGKVWHVELSYEGAKDGKPKNYKTSYAVQAKSSEAAAKIAHDKVAAAGIPAEKIKLVNTKILAESATDLEEAVLRPEYDWKIIYKKANGMSYIGTVKARSKKEAIEQAKKVYRLEDNGGFVRTATKQKKNVFESVEDTQEGFIQGEADKKRYEYRLRHPDINGINQGHIMAKSKVNALEKLKKAWPDASLVSITVVNESVEAPKSADEKGWFIIDYTRDDENHYKVLKIFTNKASADKYADKLMDTVGHPVGVWSASYLLRALSDKHKKIEGVRVRNKEEKMHEEVEDLQELSKATLGSYIKKASEDSRYLSGASRGLMAQAKGTDDHHQAVKVHDKARSRVKGVAKAVDKLTSEPKKATKPKWEIVWSYAGKKHVNHVYADDKASAMKQGKAAIKGQFFNNPSKADSISFSVQKV